MEDITMKSSSSPSPSLAPSSLGLRSLGSSSMLTVSWLSLSEAIKARNELNDGADVGDVVKLLSSVKVNSLSSGCCFIHQGKFKKVELDKEKEVLQGKDVGLYFYSTDDERRTNQELESVFESLRELMMMVEENFVVVFICLRINGHRNEKQKSGETTFWKQFKGKPWLASPFSNWRANQKLFSKFIFLSDPYDGPRLVIIRPNENIAHTYAWEIFQEYGINAYPFSKSRVTDIEVARLKSLTLNSLCSSTKHNLYDNRGGEKVSVSIDDHLLGKNVIFFLTTEPDEYSYAGHQDELIHDQVTKWYSKLKNELPQEFEMVRVIYNCNESLRKEAAERCSSNDGKKMPWLEFVPCNLHEMEAVYQLFFKAAGGASYDFLPVFVAFGQDGKLISMTTCLGRFLDDDDADKIDSRWKMFLDDSHLEEEVRDYIGRCRGWISDIEETGGRYLSQEASCKSWSWISEIKHIGKCCHLSQETIRRERDILYNNTS